MSFFFTPLSLTIINSDVKKMVISSKGNGRMAYLSNSPVWLSLPIPWIPNFVHHIHAQITHLSSSIRAHLHLLYITTLMNCCNFVFLWSQSLLTVYAFFFSSPLLSTLFVGLSPWPHSKMINPTSTLFLIPHTEPSSIPVACFERRSLGLHICLAVGP